MIGRFEARKALAVYRREIAEARSPRSLAVLGMLALLQAILMFVSRSPGRVEDTTIVFMVGGLFAVLAGCDLITREREARTIDLLLVQGLTRNTLFAAKWATATTSAVVMSAALIAGGVIGATASRKHLAWSDYGLEFVMVAWFLEVYCLAALVWSVVARRGKQALAAAVVTWLAVRPPVVGLLVLKPLREAQGWSMSQAWTVLAGLPEFAFRLALDPTRGVPQGVGVPRLLPYAALTAYVAGASIAAWLIFLGQDEPPLT